MATQERNLNGKPWAWVAGLLTCLTLVAGAGISYGSMQTRMGILEEDLAKHESLSIHPGAGRELAELKADVRYIREKLDALEEDIRDR